MKEVKATGKTVEEAVRNALDILNVTEAEAEVEIIAREKKGVLGIGNADAVVLVRAKTDPVAEGEEYLCRILNQLGAGDYDINITREDDLVKYDIASEEDVGFVIGYHGDVLDALSAVVSLAVNRDSEQHLKVSVDLNGYREKRVEALKEYAAKAAAKAAKSGYITVANPMKAFERMILHTTVQETKGVVSWSEGEEPRRRVIIAPITKVRKVGDTYERIEKREDFRRRDERRGDRKGGGRRDDRRQRAPKPIYKPEPIQVGRPVKSDFAAGLYTKIEIEPRDEEPRTQEQDPGTDGNRSGE